MESKGKSLRKLIEAPEILICPGVYDGFSARLATKYRYETAVISGAGYQNVIWDGPIRASWAMKKMSGYVVH